jgi:hypothetical protein
VISSKSIIFSCSSRIRRASATFTVDSSSLREHVLKHVVEVLHPFRCTLRDEHVEHGSALRRDFDLYLASLELTVGEQALQLFARARVTLGGSISVGRGTGT